MWRQIRQSLPVQRPSAGWRMNHNGHFEKADAGSEYCRLRPWWRRLAILNNDGWGDAVTSLSVITREKNIY